MTTERQRELWRNAQAAARARPGTKQRAAARRNRSAERAALIRRRQNPETWPSTVMQNIRYRARRLGLAFDITAADLKVPARCPVLGTPFVSMSGHNTRKNPYAPSVDRIDPSRGYVRGNVRVISLRANMLKSDATAAEVEAILRYMKEPVP